MKPEWHVEDLALRNPTYHVGSEPVYEWEFETETSREDKIAFVDEHTNGQLSYILALGEKFAQDAPNMPKDNYDLIKTVSLKAWIKKNDTEHMVDNTYRRGKINSAIVDRYIQHFDEKGPYDIHPDIVDEAFHKILKKLEIKENKWFAEHNEETVLENKLREYIDKYPSPLPFCFSSSKGLLLCANESSLNPKDERKLTVPELKELIAAYEVMEARINEASLEFLENLNFSFHEPKLTEYFENIAEVKPLKERFILAKAVVTPEYMQTLMDRYKDETGVQLQYNEIVTGDVPVVDMLIYPNGEVEGYFENSDTDIVMTDREKKDFCTAAIENDTLHDMASEMHGPYIKNSMLKGLIKTRDADIMITESPAVADAELPKGPQTGKTIISRDSLEQGDR